MSANFHETLAREEVAPPSERSTGIVFAVVAVIVAVVWRTNLTVVGVALAVAAGFALFALLAPARLRLLNIGWFKFGLLLHKVVNPVVMGLMYLVAIVPLGLIMQRFRDPLRKRRPVGASYWIAREATGAQTSMSEQF